MAQARIEKYRYGKIYAIVENREDGEELIYIGSTFQKLNNRYVNHLESAKNENNKKYDWQMYRYMREKGICNFKIKLLINYPCENEEELKIMEYDFIQRYQPKFNFIKSLEQEKKIFEENF